MTKRQQETINELRNESKELRRILMKIKQAVKCPYCLSIVSIRHGKRYTKKGIIQRYECLACHRKFMIREDSFRMRHDSKIINKAVELYEKGYSTREITNKLNENISHVTVSRWIRDFKTLPMEAQRIK